MTENVKLALVDARTSDIEYDAVYSKASRMAALAEVELTMPRLCGRQTFRSNVPASNPEKPDTIETTFPTVRHAL